MFVSQGFTPQSTQESQPGTVSTLGHMVSQPGCAERIIWAQFCVNCCHKICMKLRVYVYKY